MQNLKIERPSAIIVTFPRIFFREVSLRQFVREFCQMSESDVWFCKFAAIPRCEVIHCYIVIENRVRYRANLVGFDPGGEMIFADGRTATARAWMLLCGPIVKAPYRISMRGFQGFRYSQLLF